MKYEFCFSIAPKTGRAWPKKLACGGFEVELANDELLLRSDSTAMSDDALKTCADTVAKSITRALGFEERQPVVGSLARVVRTTPGQATGSTVLVADKVELLDHVEAVVEVSHRADAYVVSNSRAVAAERIAALADRARRSPSLQHMLSWMMEFWADPDMKLAPLFNILEFIEGEMGGSTQAAFKLGISLRSLKRARRITNDQSIRTARHPGIEPHSLREVTPEELNQCIQTVESVVHNYAQKVVA